MSVIISTVGRRVIIVRHTGECRFTKVITNESIALDVCSDPMLYIQVEKSFHEMKGDRDDKSAKTSATRNYPSAVVVNDHMYPRPLLYHFFMFQ